MQRSAIFRLAGHGPIVVGRRRYLQSGLDDGRAGRFRRYGGRDGNGRAHDGRQRDDGRHRRRLHPWVTTTSRFDVRRSSPRRYLQHLGLCDFAEMRPAKVQRLTCPRVDDW